MSFPENERARVCAGGLWGAPLRVFDTLKSTNTSLLELGDACAHGETVRALRQTAGRGRDGRVWHSDAGVGLTFSVALRESKSVGGAEYQGVIAALALAIFLERHELEPRLKWPNDVLVGQRKIAGVLGESNSDFPDVVVVGIGFNVNQSATDFDCVGLAGTAVSLEMLTGRRHALGGVFQNILDVWRQTVDGLGVVGLKGVAAAWRRRDALAGCRVRAEIAGRPLHGLVLGVDERMGLRIRDDGGVVHVLRSGEVTHIGRGHKSLSS